MKKTRNDALNKNSELNNIFILQASKNVANFFACWDLMEITTLSNLMALASDTTGISFDAGDAKLSGEEFYEIIREIYDKIDMLKKWTREGKQFLSLKQFNFNNCRNRRRT